MRILKFLIPMFLASSTCSGQNPKPTDFVLSIDGVELDVAIDQTILFKLKSGAEIPIVLKRRAFSRFVDGALSFQYPGKYTLASAKIDDDITQHTVVTALGTMMLVQKYEGGVPAALMDVMFDKMVEEPKAMGLAIQRSTIQRNIANGQTLQGVRASYKGGDDDVNIDFMSTNLGSTGYFILTMNDAFSAPDEVAVVEQFWQQLAIDTHPAP
jgi:hypothetical protein